MGTACRAAQGRGRTLSIRFLGKASQVSQVSLPITHVIHPICVRLVRLAMRRSLYLKDVYTHYNANTTDTSGYYTVGSNAIIALSLSTCARQGAQPVFELVPIQQRSAAAL